MKTHDPEKEKQLREFIYKEGRKYLLMEDHPAKREKAKSQLGMTILFKYTFKKKLYNESKGVSYILSVRD